MRNDLCVFTFSVRVRVCWTAQPIAPLVRQLTLYGTTCVYLHLVCAVVCILSSTDTCPADSSTKSMRNDLCVFAFSVCVRVCRTAQPIAPLVRPPALCATACVYSHGVCVRVCVCWATSPLALRGWLLTVCGTIWVLFTNSVWLRVFICHHLPCRLVYCRYSQRPVRVFTTIGCLRVCFNNLCVWLKCWVFTLCVCLKSSHN